MSLDSSEKVYQADLMHVTPMADALIYGYEGDWILAGMEAEITATGVEIQPGRAIIQGHLYTLDSTKTIPLQAGVSGYIGWSIDLTADNSAVGTYVTNNQYTFGFFTNAPAGDTLNGDTVASVAMCSITASGSSWNIGGDFNSDPATLVRRYHEKITYSDNFPGSQLGPGVTGDITIERYGHLGRLYISLRSVSPLDGNAKDVLAVGTVPTSLLPIDHNYQYIRTTYGTTGVSWYTSGNSSSGALRITAGLGASSETGQVYNWSSTHKSGRISIYGTIHYMC